MKSKITFSRFANALTAIINAALFFGCIFTVREGPTFLTLLILLVILLLVGLIFGPLYVKADPDYLILGSILRKRRLRIEDIESVELFQPSGGAIRICASGGYMGYWGLFREREIGKYYAFYGKSSDCFLVRMINGDKYVIGCDHPETMTDYINSILNGKTH